jgi:quercetin dioxygenase-like cupin family protein
MPEAMPVTFTRKSADLSSLDMHTRRLSITIDRKCEGHMAMHHAKPQEIVDLGPLGPDLKDAKTAAIIKGDHFETIRLIVHAGAEIPQHKVIGEITLHCLEGRVELGVDPRPIVLKANEWVYLKGGAPHSFKAIEDSSLLLTIFLNRT